MQNKQEQIEIHISDLPEEILYKFSDSIEEEDEQSKCAIASAHRLFGHNVFQTHRILARLSQYIAEARMDMVDKLREIRPDLNDQILSLVQEGLFILAGYAEQDKMEQILKHYPELFFTYASLKDISGIYPVIPGRKGITVFQHALWAGDIPYMCNMMLNCLPKNAYGDEIRIELLRQFNELMDKGVIYWLEGKIREEKQFSLEPMIKAFQNYINVWNNPTLSHKSWCEGVGLAQTYFPAYIRHKCCAPEGFCNGSGKLTRTLRVYMVDNILEWNDSLTGLGSKFAIYRDDKAVAIASSTGAGTAKDLEKMAFLNEKLDAHRDRLIVRLNSPIQMKELPMPVSRCTIS